MTTGRRSNPPSSGAHSNKSPRPCGAIRPSAQEIAMTLARIVAVFLFVCCATAARADAVDDALAKFLDNKFSSTEQGVNALAATGAANAPAILDALDDNRLLIDPVDHIIVYQTSGGDLINAKTGEKLSGVDV